MTGYRRDQFGPAWTDEDDNGCDTRYDILRRDLSDTALKRGTHGWPTLGAPEPKRGAPRGESGTRTIRASCWPSTGTRTKPRARAATSLPPNKAYCCTNATTR